MLENVIVRYAKKREPSLRWSDVAATSAVAFAGSLTLRHEHVRDVGGD